MTVQRQIWRQSFTIWPRLPCPSCKIGTLKIDKNSISENETASSKAIPHDEHWHPDQFEKRFIATMVCTGPTCADIISVCGEVSQEWDYALDPDGDVYQEFENYYEPVFFDPAPPLFPIPYKCPKGVKEELKKAFALIWPDHGSAANCLRVAVEELMDALKVQKKAQIKSGKNIGKFQDLTLHGRIKKFETKNSVAATQLMAIKWLGNVGSHAVIDKLTRDDLLDAFEHFEYAIDLIYVKQSAALEKRAKRINKSRGPVRVE